MDQSLGLLHHAHYSLLLSSWRDSSRHFPETIRFIILFLLFKIEDNEYFLKFDWAKKG